MKMDILSALEHKFPSFSKGQRTIAQFILKNYDKAAFMTAARLGEVTGVSESTVVRFAADLGYRGYPGMKKALQEIVRNRLTSVERIEAAESTMDGHDVLKAVLRADINNLQATLDEVDQDNFDQAVDMILSAKHIYIIGMRTSTTLADFLGIYLKLLLDNVTVVKEIAAREGRSLYDVIRRANEYEELKRAAVKLIQFCDMLGYLRELSETQPVDALYDAVLEQTGYIRALQEKGGDESLARIENVNELKTNILGYIKETGDTSLSGFLDEVALYTDIDSYDRDADCAVMMTMHSAKGLEFPDVFIVGMEEGLFPGARCIGDPEEMEEERRLCYVALTRAKERLCLTCARQRMIFGRTSMNLPSRFTEEIPEEDLEKSGFDPARQAEHREQGEGQRYMGFGKRRVAPPVQRQTPDQAPAPAKSAPAFGLGDRIVHRAFGRGEITKLTPMGGDALIEITFDDVGVKRLMLRAASQHMKKET